MPRLLESKCEACRSDSAPVTDMEKKSLMREITDWTIVDLEGVPTLQRKFTFPDFIKALEFSCLVGEMAEEEDHHPSLLTEWGRVTVTWWTHKIKGLHKNDFIMAAKTDRLYDSQGASQ